MKFFEITYMLDKEHYERLSALGERYGKVKGWDEKEMLQFAVTAMARDDIEKKLRFLEEEIIRLEREWLEHTEGQSGQVYISEEERVKCRKVVNAYSRELDNAGVIVIEAGRYGFVKLMYYKFPDGFGDVATFTDSRELFLDLWEEWLEEQLLEFAKNTPMAEMDYGDMFKCLPKEKQAELMAKREYFAQKAEICLS